MKTATDFVVVQNLSWNSFNNFTYQLKKNKTTPNKKYCQLLTQNQIPTKVLKLKQMHTSTFLPSETLNKWDISMGHTVKLSVSQKEFKRHSLLFRFKNLPWVRADTTISTFKHKNILNYRTPAQNLLMFREGKEEYLSNYKRLFVTSKLKCIIRCIDWLC